MKTSLHSVRFVGTFWLWVVGLALVAERAEAQVLTVNRLVPKTVVSGERAGDPGEVAMGGGYVVLGAPGAVNARTGVASGGVYVFDVKTGKELATVFPPDGDANAGMEFGHAVAISGTMMVIGAPGADLSPAGNQNRGAAYVYDLKTGKFVGAKFQPGNLVSGERMGQVVAIDGDWIAVASPNALGFGVNATVATGLVLAIHVPTRREIFVSPDGVKLPGATVGAAGDEFGAGLALRGKLLVVGAPGATVSGQADAGRVYVVNLGFNGVLVDEIENPDTGAGGDTKTNDLFGRRVAIGSRFLVVGAPGDQANLGEFHVFDARTPADMASFGSIKGEVANGKLGEAIATEGVRIFYRFTDRVVTGFAPSGLGAFNPSQFFLTSEAVDGGYGAALAVADEMLAVGAPTWGGGAVNGGSVVLHPTTAIQAPDVYVSQYTGDSAAGVGTGDGVVDFLEVAANLQVPATYTAGNPMYFARLAGPEAVAGRSVKLFAYDSSVSEVALLGGTDALVPTMTRPIGNGVGAWWWRGSHKAGNLPNFFSSGGGAVTAKLHNGNGTLFGVNLPLKAVDELRVDNKATDAAAVSMRLKAGGAVDGTNDSGILLMDVPSSGIPRFWGREGDAFNAGKYGEFAPRLAMSARQFTFSAALTGTGFTTANNQLVFLASAVSVLRGDAAPGVLNAVGAGVAATFSTFTGETHSDDSKGLFRATLNPAPGVTGAINEGLWTNRTGPVEMVLQKGQLVPLVGESLRVKRFLNYAIVHENDILVLAQVSGPGVNAGNDVVLLLSTQDGVNPGTWEVLAREGDRLPGTNGAKVGVILRVEVATTDAGDGNNRYGVLCSLVTEAGRVTAANNLVWVVGETAAGAFDQEAVRQPLPKVRKGEGSGFFGAGYERITSIAFPVVTRDATGALNTGMAHVIDPRHGGSTGVVTFPNKKKGVGLIW